jgi:hypothetical protein
VADASPVRFTVQRRTAEGAFEILPGAVVANDAAAFPAEFVWRDDTVTPGVRYEYRLEVVLRDGTREAWDRIAGAVAGAAPRVALLGANPVRRGGPIGVEVDMLEAGAVRVTLFDVAGRPVRVLHEGTWGPGHHTAARGSGDARSLGAGVYFLAVRGAGLKETARVVVLD